VYQKTPEFVVRDQIELELGSNIVANGFPCHLGTYSEFSIRDQKEFRFFEPFAFKPMINFTSHGHGTPLYLT